MKTHTHTARARERDRETQRDRDRESVCLCVCVSDWWCSGINTVYISNSNSIVVCGILHCCTL